MAKLMPVVTALLALQALAFGKAMPETEFTAELFGHLQARKGNLFLSPASIYMALAMTYAGARNETAAEIARALKVSDAKALHDAETSFLEQVGNPKSSYQLVLANSFWGQKGLDFLPDFVKLLESQYQSTVNTVDFKHAREEARATINKWVEEKTRSKIKDLLAPGTVTESTRLVLVNAIYFKAAWQHQFLKVATRSQPFYLDQNRAISVPLMAQTKIFPYYEEADFQAVELPYFGGDIGMVILLPRGRTGLPALEKKLTAENWQKWSDGLSSRNLALALPRFKVTAEFRLGETLKDLGIKKAFSGSADFSGMSASPGLGLSEVVHKAFVDVNEEGTEAAAATAAVMYGAAMMGPPPVKVIADHPFLFAIRERKSGRLLFLGRLVNPDA